MTSRLNLTGFSEEYLVHIPEIDEQHRTFFTLLDTMGKAVPDLYKPLDDEGADAIIDVLDELRDYAMLHFRTEEGYMQEINYPGLAKQKREHNRFITDVIRMQGELLNGSAMPAIKIRNFMHDRYRDHILNLDKPFGKTYKKIKG
ncbi:MAG: bacteriohemerythrin [Pseudodesulfovibrio sp.]|uniref:Hemerythrin-like metal-binding protein n=1 Tax=Pseudodesulfovibrio aespoeensis (strain ATCC 700646 / DSM 10631 / Aspo-2) TaxID=643562 RepID=E6VW38_PSEA9|nr:MULTISPECIES: bacteriohemerythrin [Pseudodesulfovibrio]MBU4244762.1 bacteriohemerythrin [Pseudomonadota bacterium]ADU63598.1 hemerythrin-like metal-binding protein [Pseudodesulfovibrio aespoeensis Aspo-2]MBU4378847.1 bacteriohemerythrin [Pseudomonadota bacterium]MBU4475293.1 bacteriohemerythrin [Pseudomonadota bacterium]MBU4514744.1 bacteriohemerythrin [Pseudomonadota bacterium]